MGLEITVGYFLDVDEEDLEWVNDVQENFQELNGFLQSSGLNPHHEPKNFLGLAFEMAGYAPFNLLRQFAAHVTLMGQPPDPGAEGDPEAAILLSYFDKFAQSSKDAAPQEFDHVVLHNDAEGFYLPQGFPRVLAAPEGLELAVDWIGSSQQLLEQTAGLADILELSLDMDPEAEALWLALDGQGPQQSMR